jgi:ketosteroid isomerase-like protein
MKLTSRLTGFGLTVVAIVAFTGLAAFSSFAQVTAAGNPAARQAEESVRQASATEVKAFLDKDARQLASLWSDDMVVTNPLNKFVNKHQVLGMVQSGMLTFTAYDRAIEYAHVYGNTVILAGNETVTWGSRMPHAGKTERLLFTAIWMKRDGRWQEVARHANVVPARPM